MHDGYLLRYWVQIQDMLLAMGDENSTNNTPELVILQHQAQPLGSDPTLAGTSVHVCIYIFLEDRLLVAHF